MKVLVTGSYKESYNRILILLSGLKKLGVDVVTYRYEKRNSTVAKKLKELSPSFDVVFLPSFTHADVPFVRRYVNVPVVFDPLVSRYLTKVFDRQKVWKYSPRAFKNFLKDKRAFKNSDIIIADTQSHKDYYSNTFGIDPGKIVVVPVGVDTEFFYPLEMPGNKETVTVGFYGTFIPLHGIDRIIQSAALLKDQGNIRFEIYGKGPLLERTVKECRKLGLTNVEFKGWVEYRELNREINSMDICLGIFGESLKTDLVIPNKIYHYAACGKPVITKETPGIMEIFTPGENIVLSRNDPESMAAEIQNLAGDMGRRRKIGMNAHDLITGEYNDIKVAGLLLDAFGKAAGKKV